MNEEREETERQKRIRRAQEATVYRVQEDFGKKSGVYRVTKRVIDVEMEVYHVTYRGTERFCDCPGFLRQKYPAEQHKHIRAVRDFVEKHNGANYADYRFVGSGQNTKVRFIRSA